MTNPHTPSRISALPMYQGGHPRAHAFWAALAGLLRERGLQNVPDHLTASDSLHAQWLAPQLLLSQACGYPLVTQLKAQVQVLGTFAYDAPGCQGVMCRSQLLVRQADAALALSAFAGRTVAFNSQDSQSGYNSLRALVAPLAQHGHFFGQQVPTGGHLLSIDAVREGQADMAAIDCVTLAGVARYQPEKLEGLHVWGETAAYPGLPLITSASTSAQEVAILREALAHISTHASYRQVCEPLLIQGFEALNYADYQVCTDMREQALALGVESL